MIILTQISGKEELIYMTETRYIRHWRINTLILQIDKEGKASVKYKPYPLICFSFVFPTEYYSNFSYNLLFLGFKLFCFPSFYLTKILVSPFGCPWLTLHHLSQVTGLCHARKKVDVCQLSRTGNTGDPILPILQKRTESQAGIY